MKNLHIAKLVILSIIFFIASVNCRGQNFPACDSLVINCCTIDSLGTSTITITVSNFSSVLFDYPGIVLFDANMDTIAKETVNYFGIGTGPQVHIMEIFAPVTLPFTGFLNLYTLFYDTLACSFPVIIPDTSTGIGTHFPEAMIDVFPNPTSNEFSITLNNRHEEFKVEIFDFAGRPIIKETYINPSSRIVFGESLPPGMYLLKVISGEKANTLKLIKN